MLFSRFLLIAIFVLPSLSSISQNSTVIHVNGSKMRVPLEVAKGESSVALNGLIPGNTYVVTAARAAAGQLVTLELAPSKFTKETARDISVLSARKNILRFTAITDRVDFNVIAAT